MPSFGDVVVDNSGSGVATLRNTGELSVTVLGVATEGPFALADAGSDLVNRVLPPNGEMQMQLLFQPKSIGSAAGTIIVSTSHFEVRGQLTGQGVAERRPAFTVAELLSFGVVSRSATQERKLLVTNTGESDGTILSASIQSSSMPGAPDNFWIEGGPFRVPAGASIEISVFFRPTEERDYAEWLLFDVAAAGADFVVRVTGTGEELEIRGRLSCQPTNIDFGPLPRDGVRSRSITCSPVGGAIEVRSAQIQRPFAVAPFIPGLWAEGSFHTMTVEFDTEVAAESYFEQLNIEYEGAAGSSTLQLPVSGRVLPPPPEDTEATIVLRWDTQTDIDLHLTPSGDATFGDTDCYYGRLAPDWGQPFVANDNPFLDFDNTAGLGPETINVGTLPAGAFDVYVHYFSGPFDTPATEATVQIFLNGVIVATPIRILNNCNDQWHVGTIRSENGAFTFEETNVIGRAPIDGCGF